MKYAVVGSRTCTSPRKVFPVLRRLLSPGDIIISGGAKGVDSLAEVYAKDNDHTIIVHKAQWGLHGKAAGPIRNKQIVEDCDEVIAFWDGSSRGTRNTLGLAKETRKPIHVFWI